MPGEPFAILSKVPPQYLMDVRDLNQTHSAFPGAFALLAGGKCVVHDGHGLELACRETALAAWRDAATVAAKMAEVRLGLAAGRPADPDPDPDDSAVAVGPVY